jgi:hypothetical protein
MVSKHQWKHFKALFPNQAWVETLITNDMNVSRRPLAHMNPLSVRRRDERRGCIQEVGQTVESSREPDPVGWSRRLPLG